MKNKEIEKETKQKSEKIKQYGKIGKDLKIKYIGKKWKDKKLEKNNENKKF